MPPRRDKHLNPNYLKSLSYLHDLTPLKFIDRIIIERIELFDEKNKSCANEKGSLLAMISSKILLEKKSQKAKIPQKYKRATAEKFIDDKSLIRVIGSFDAKRITISK